MKTTILPNENIWRVTAEREVILPLKRTLVDNVLEICLHLESEKS